jgi:hypothetical protein
MWNIFYGYRDGKERPEFTNVEKNIYEGLQDVPTQTELAVLALYAQAISHPYMREVRGPGTEHVNMLNLGPLHFKIRKHLEKLIENPDLLISQQATYHLGATDGTHLKLLKRFKNLHLLCHISGLF